MAGLVPAIHDLSCRTNNVDARDKPGHDEFEGKDEFARQDCLSKWAIRAIIIKYN